MRQFFHACLFVCLVFFTVNAQAQKVNPANLLKDFLDLPAPAPVDEAAAQFLKNNASYRSPEFYAPDRVPSDDAPIEELIDYWSKQSPPGNVPRRVFHKPSEKALARILDYCEENPAYLYGFLGILERTPKIAESVKKIYDKMLADEETGYTADQVKRWLTYNSNYFVDELVKKAEKVRDKDKYVTNQAELLALSRVDWERAAPILERLEGDGAQPVSRTLARWAFYARAIETENEGDVTKYRRLLQETVENRSLSAGNRDLAMDALVVEKEWDGREDWYVSLLSDETLYKLDNYTGLTTILRFITPEKMIPAMVKLVDSKNPAVRKAAVRNLVTYVKEDRVEAIRALLPWLSNPNWITEIPDGRAALISALGKTDMPEAVPALIMILMNEEEHRQAAAEALIRYKDPRAVPALKIALANEKVTYRRIIYIKALDECGGLGDDEKMAALELYAAVISTPEAAAQYSGDLYRQYDENTPNPTPVALTVGNYVAEQPEPSDGLVVRLLERLKTLRKTKPATALALQVIMQKWRGRIIYIERLRQIRAGEADLPTILLALAQRREIREKNESDILALRLGSGIGRGIVPCLAEDAADFLSVLRQTDADAQIAMLGCARLLRAKLPVAEVGALMKSANKTIALAAERYLESEDSPEARTLILERHAGEAFILGARQAFIPDQKNYAFGEPLRLIFDTVTGRGFFPGAYPLMEKNENVLRDEMKSNPDLLAIFGILTNKPAGQQIIRVFKDKIVFTNYEDAARYRERVLTAKEYEDFYRLVLEEKIDTAAPFFGYCEECEASEFVMFGKNGGRRVFFVNALAERSPVKKISERFASFNEGNLKLHYRLADKIKGLEVLLADEKYMARAVWKNGRDLRVLVEDKDKEAEIQKNLAAEFEVENKVEIEEENYQQIQERAVLQEKRREESQYAHFFWRGVESAGSLGEVRPQPPEIPYLYDETQFPETDGIDANPRAWKVRAGNFEIRVSDSYNPEAAGLFKVSRAQAPVKFKAGNYDFPVVTADGNWVIVTKTTGEWGEPKALVRVNLQTGKEFPVNLPPADTFTAIAFIDSQNKVLIYRAKGINPYNYRQNQNADDDEEVAEVKPSVSINKADAKNPSPATPEYYLLDAATGATQIVKGEFRPLENMSYRPLQPAGAPGEFWTAVYDKKAKETTIGRYNTNTFTLQPVTKLPQIVLDSMNIWVDEKEAKVYFVYEGHLLSAPLPNQQK
jgi:hypothetical protein